MVKLKDSKKGIKQKRAAKENAIFKMGRRAQTGVGETEVCALRFKNSFFFF